MFIRYKAFYYFIALLLTSLIIYLNSYFIFFYILYLFFVFKRLNGKHAIIILIFSFLYGMISFVNVKEIDEHQIGIITSLDEDSFVLKTSQHLIQLYYTDLTLKEGDKIACDIVYQDIAEASNFEAFDYKNYLYGKKIFHQGSVSHFEILQNRQTLRAKVINHIQTMNDGKVKDYTTLFVLGNKNESIETIYTYMQTLSLTHIFVLSGMHIQLLYQVMVTCLEKIMERKYAKWVSFFLLYIYVFLILQNHISAIRVFLMIIFTYFNKNYFSKLDLISCIGMIFLFYNPYIFYNTSFILSFYFYIGILLIPKNKYKWLYIVSLVIPVSLYLQYQISITGLLLGAILLPLVGCLFIVLILNLLLFQSISFIAVILIEIFEKVIAFVLQFNLVLPFQKPDIFFYIGYLCILYLLLKKVTLKQDHLILHCILFSYLMAYYFKPYYTITGQVTMIDVGQGDCILISQPFNQGTILIDTGGNINYDVASKIIIPYLKSQGIHDIDTLIITHDDFDHNGAKDSLITNFKVKEVIENKVDIIQNGNLVLYGLLHDQIYDSKNDNSIILYTKINKLYYLFLGDIGEKVEKDLVNRYPDLLVDVLKIAHHGSLTSTSSQLLSSINPKYAFISVAKNNIYRLPSPIVVDRILAYGITLKQTANHGMIRIRYNFLGNFLETKKKT